MGKMGRVLPEEMCTRWLPLPEAGPIAIEAFSKMVNGAFRDELLHGRLLLRPPRFFGPSMVSSDWLFRLGSALDRVSDDRVIPGCGFILAHDPDTVLAPDIAVFSFDRAKSRNTYDWPEDPPAFAFEFLCSFDDPVVMQERVDAFLDAGTLAVIVVDSEREEIVVHRPGAAPHVPDDAHPWTLPEPYPPVQFRLSDIRGALAPLGASDGQRYLTFGRWEQ